MLREISRVGSRIIIAVAAFVALSLAVAITTRLIDRFGPLSIWEVMGRSLICMAFGASGRRTRMVNANCRVDVTLPLPCSSARVRA
jgi:hypothetical protein